MKRALLLSILLSIILVPALCLPVLSFNNTATYEADGEVLGVDALAGRVQIRHAIIKGFSEPSETEFFVRSGDLLKGISKRDLVHFVVEEKNANAEIVSIQVTGQAPIPSQGLEVGKAVQDVLVATGEAAKVVVSPIEPAHGAVSEVVGATTSATGAVLEDATVPDTKQNF